MRLRTVATVFVAIALTACSDKSATTAPTSRIAAPAAAHLDLVATNATINSLIDQLFYSPFIRAYVHASWNNITTQLATCPPTATSLALQTSLNQLVAFISASQPRGNSAKAALLTQLITAMNSYVNEAIAACPTV